MSRIIVPGVFRLSQSSGILTVVRRLIVIAPNRRVVVMSEPQPKRTQVQLGERYNNTTADRDALTNPWHGSCMCFEAICLADSSVTGRLRIRRAIKREHIWGQGSFQGWGGRFCRDGGSLRPSTSLKRGVVSYLKVLHPFVRIS